MRRLAVLLAVAVLGAAVVWGVVHAGHDATTASGAGVAASGDSSTDADDPGQLDPALANAFVKAQAEAARAGVTVTITSGWRSAAHQQELYEAAIKKYGSPEIARQWVLPPSESDHVRGKAIDVGPPAGARWLEENGERFGLCRAYANETWHFELLAPALGQKCPAMRPHA